MEFKINVQNEVVIGGHHVLAMLVDIMRMRQNPVDLLRETNMLVIKDEQGTRISLLPKCDCKMCTHMCKIITKGLREGNIEQLHQDVMEVMRECEKDDESDL